MITYNQWLDYFQLDENGEPVNGDDGLPITLGKEYYFDITVSQFNLDVASSTGFDPQDLADGIENPPFNQAMYDAFNITIDQLEGEINLPYVYERTDEYQRIRVAHSLLGGFTQFRINYQYIYYPSDAYLEDVTSEGFIHDGFIQTSRTIVPRGTPPTPPLPPPVFEIDDGQIKEALADKIYEKFFNSDIIEGGVSDIKSIQTTTSTDGQNYGTGRQSEDDQLIFFKKDRNTPENLRDFGGDGSNGIQAIANAISSSLAGTDARGRVDLSDKLDDELSMERADEPTRTSSGDLEPSEYVLNEDGEPTDTPLYYRGEINYKLVYTINGADGNGNQISQIIEVPFAKQYQFFQQQSGDLRQQIPNPNGTGTVNRPDEWGNQLNISQLTIAKPGVKPSREKALSVLDTNIFELLPGGNQRQNEINNFFQRFFQLIGPKPNFTDEDGNGILETIQDYDSQSNTRISSEDGRDNPGAFITRTNDEADSFNTNKTLESMRDTLNEYLGDVDTVVEEINEQRPEYENKSEGFLKIRRLNQSILIKSPAGESSFDGWEQTGFTVTMWVRFLNTIGGGSLFTYGNPFLRNSSSFRLETLTKQAGDVLINHNPSGDSNDGLFVYSRPKRIIRLVVWENVVEDFMLEAANVGNWAFSDFMTNTVGHDRRFGYLYDSSVPYNIPESDYENTTTDNAFSFSNGFNKQYTWFTQHSATDIRTSGGSYNKRDYNFTQYTDIPTDNLDEWFFICATYDPNIKEIRSTSTSYFENQRIPYNLSGQTPPKKGRQIEGVGYGEDDYPIISAGNYPRNENFWLNHVDENGNTVANSGLGNKCKVEVISRSDLLRARGYRL
tara:strand:- start:1842 stop:4361 length:2520 start_codon:yes stop_codon:yes gene_type:complete